MFYFFMLKIQFKASISPSKNAISFDGDDGQEIKLVIPTSDKMAILKMTELRRKQFTVTVTI